MNTYITADYHLNHSNILKHCHRLAFMNDNERRIMTSSDQNAIATLRVSQESTERMNNDIIANTNKLVQPKDQLIIVGDFCWVRGNIAKIESTYKFFRRQISCENVILLWGNHEPKQRHIEARRSIAKHFSATYNLLVDDIEGYPVTICHYAMLSWDRSHHGAICCYGHGHGSMEDRLDEIFPKRHSMDIGIDNAYKLFGEYRPFSFKEVSMHCFKNI